MKPMFLVIDTEQTRITGLFTLCNANMTDFYSFENADDVRNFTQFYYCSPIAAIAAYRMVFDA